MINPFLALGEFIKINAENTSHSLRMAGSTLKKHYSGALFGWAWSIVRPIVFIFVYWFAISLGIRGNKPIVINDAEYPYVIWMIPGVIAWFVLQETLSSGVMCIRSNSHLVNKMVFPIATIPVFNVISYFVSHLVMIAIAAFIFIVSGTGITLYFIQIFYYLILFFIFCCITATLISTLGAFSRDFEQLIKAVMNVVFWLTPVLWQIDRLPAALQTVMKFNPFNYFVTGYRDAFLGIAWFWEHPAYDLYVAVFLIVYALFTSVLFKKLSPEFADVL